MRIHSFQWAEFQKVRAYHWPGFRVVFALLLVLSLAGMALVQMFFALPLYIIVRVWGEGFEPMGLGISYMLAGAMLTLYVHALIAWGKAGYLLVEGAIVTVALLFWVTVSLIPS